MLAADRSLLEVNLRQSAIKLREKELNLFTENFNSMSTQAAVLAGFTTTCLIELTIPDNANQHIVNLLHIFSAISISANITCVSISTMVSIWGSGKALRGRDGSMDEAVDGMLDERKIIFKAFALGLFGNLCTVLFSCWVRMSLFASIFATCVIGYTMSLIYTNFLRIQKKFHVPDPEAVRLDDLTQPGAGRRGGNGSSSPSGSVPGGRSGDPGGSLSVDVEQGLTVDGIQRQIEQLMLMQQHLAGKGGGRIAATAASPSAASNSTRGNSSSSNNGLRGSNSLNNITSSSDNSNSGASNNGHSTGRRGGDASNQAIEELFSLLPSSSSSNRPPPSKYNV